MAVIIGKLPTGSAITGPNGVTGYVYVEDVTTALGPYVSVRVYRGTTTDPLTAAFTTLVATLTLVSGTEQYSFTDASGVANSLYRAAYYTGSADSGLGAIFRPGFTLRALLIEAARQAYGGFSGLCSGAGTTVSLPDVALTDTGKDAYFQEGAFLYRPDAAAAGDKIRRVSEGGFNTTTGAFTVRTYTNAPASAEEYHVYNFYPPHDYPGMGYSWARAARDGLRDAWFMDQLNLGEGTSTGQTHFSLNQFGNAVTRDSIYNVMYRTTDSNGIISDALLRNNMWSVQENDTDGLTLIVSQPPSTTETLVVEVKRRFLLPFIDTDIVVGPQELAVAATCRQLFLRLGGQKDPRYVEWQAKYRQAYRVHGAMPRVLV